MSSTAAERSGGADQLTHFVLLTFALTWGLLGPWFYLMQRRASDGAPVWLWSLAPLAFIGGWGPTVAAALLTRRTQGWLGVRALARSMLDVRGGWHWIALAVMVPLVCNALALCLAAGGPTILSRWDFTGLLRRTPAILALALPFGPLGEEAGWRGYALDRLITRMGTLRATLVLGLVWALWHLPMILWWPGAAIPSAIGVGFRSVLTYLVLILAESALLNLLYLRAGRRVGLAVLGHLMLNTAGSIVLSGLPDPSADMQRSLFGTTTLVLALLAAASLPWLARVQGQASAQL